jgi:hypothetical protein
VPIDNGSTTADHPAGTVPINGASSALICATSTSPETTPTGRGTDTVLVVDVLPVELEAPTLMPSDGEGVVTVTVLGADVLEPEALVAVRVTG